jgi:hypothetical protein
MFSERKRRFTLLDMLILTAATAIGLAWTRAYLSDFSAVFPSSHPQAGSWMLLRVRIHGITTCLLICWTLALLAIQLRRPRPRLRRLAQRPGMAACNAVALIAVYQVLHLLSWSLIRAPLSQPIWTFVAGCQPSISAAVAAAWLTLAMSGRWRAEPDWIDRAGRVAGACWLGLVIVEWIALLVGLW